MLPPLALPPSLAQHVVAQDYTRYSEVAHAVWRFVMLHLREHLATRAHPAYLDGLTQTGIGSERIPRIEQMDECLDRFGWRAVCVDGFIPPRAFQALQALGILAIAADIRSPGHLAYTPAPDILHEAAGHAPLVVDPVYAAYLKANGRVASMAFSLPEDRALYQAVHWLSEVKETPGATTREVQAASVAFERARRAVTRTSEATRLARLFWWTAEYGLVGTARDFRLYGAGLLSSLGESNSCLEPAVEKRLLSTDCLEQDFDITRPQPHLYVARDFAHLHEVLEQAERTLVAHRGGPNALSVAQSSAELASFECRGVQRAVLLGTLKDYAVQGETARWLRLEGPGRVALRVNGAWQLQPGIAPHLPALAWGPLANGQFPDQGSEQALRAGQPLHLRYRSGLELRAVLQRRVLHEGQLLGLELWGASLTCGEQTLFSDAAGSWLLAREFVTARPASADPSLHSPELDDISHSAPAFAGAGDPSASTHAGALDPSEGTRKPASEPRPSLRTAPEQQLTHLYERALETWRSKAGSDVVHTFALIHQALTQQFPEEWLLRWNLLESLLKLGVSDDFTRALEAELLALEAKFNHQEPIATGLRSLRQRYGSPSAEPGSSSADRRGRA